MKFRMIFGIAVFGILLLIHGVNPVRVAAQTPTNTDPSRMKIFDNHLHVIPPNTPLWYVFYYAGDKSPFQIKMAEAADTGLGFRLYTPEQVARLRSGDKPLGQGSANNVSCGTGRCQSADLTWDGASSTEGVYIIEVTNVAPVAQIFNMIVTGPGVQIGPPLADALSIVTPTPPTLPNLVPGVVPTFLSPTPSKPALPCNGEAWRFDADPYC